MSLPKISPSLLQNCIKTALNEDQAFRDITSRTLIKADQITQANIIAKTQGIICGLPVVRAVFQQVDPNLKCTSQAKEGSLISPNMILMRVSGKARSILAGERVALNFLQHLSGVASQVRQFVKELKGTQAKLLDTRKTIPGLRFLERYAVKVGGGENHRFDLASGVMIKDNHWALIASQHEAWKKLQKLKSKIPIVWEVENIAQVKAALELGVKWIQLDNMSLSQLREAVKLAQGRCKLEATGGITLKNIRHVAKTGVDYISVGAVTHSAPALDISLEIESG